MNPIQFDDYKALDGLLQELKVMGKGYEALTATENSLLKATMEQLKSAARSIDESVVLPLPDKPEGVSEPTKQAARAALSSSVLTAALTIGQIQQQFQNMASQARGILQKTLQWFLNHLFAVLNAVAAHLNIDSWSVQASGGFPWGVNIAITLTFK